MKNILDLTSAEAKEFFLKEESYFTLDLPVYFKFANLLKQVSQKLNGSNLSDFYLVKDEKSQNPKDFENVNYKILNNKDGEYSWRLFQLIHPALYVSLVHKITEKNNWSIIVSRFRNVFQKNDAIQCTSLPVIKSEEQKSDKAGQISSWWKNTEQQSIKLSLKYDYIFHADIVDCYGSLYTHSIAWALHGKEHAKQNKNDDSLIGVAIDYMLRCMTNGQTNGIPQGSVLMDFVAEIVLGYIDIKLSKKISTDKHDYHIIRYRDDYHIFANNPTIGKEIVKELTNILSDLGMRLSPEKTKYSNNIIRDSIKPDKLFWVTSKTNHNSLQNQLLLILDLSEKYPNSGTLKKQLQYFYNRIEKRKEITEDIDVLISILVGIAYKNPIIYPISSAILSKFIVFITQGETQKELIKEIKNKFDKLLNTEYLDLWLQRITLKIDKDILYQGGLCNQNNFCEKVEDSNTKI